MSKTSSPTLKTAAVHLYAGIVNEDRSEEGDEIVKGFIAFLKSDEAKKVFEKYYFDTKVD